MKNKVKRVLSLVLALVLVLSLSVSCGKGEKDGGVAATVASFPMPDVIAVGHGDFSQVYTPGSHEYEHIFSELNRGMKSQSFRSLDYDYGSTVNSTKTDTYYVELKYKYDASFVVPGGTGEIEFSGCKNILVLFSGELSGCILAEGHKVLSGMSADDPLTAYVKELADKVK